mmetsp:Transcript_22847/g.47916  ORF Transcript_22847/g.47916 Transcript_22847/m.47916 type:complete len:300 (+) Transcript_22847:130-1029(+)|eukprot:CAMPEP_0168300110 /NCGR_PEP_ID=MMETSP0142_2-20121227/29526_1 /TAXON_ID=44445 /ORGANISM="Pseudo-nitzschia australis, Strain 10249 10 AB" /LENGTH=299 /DNA_ID=CAMNT_0008249991 /DNA_START=42 /DNA_END=941 /DNA_ORIENTATION=-
MRLTAELIASSEQRTNPLGEREIVMRGLAIPVIEHLGVTRDAYDAMDLTDNRISRLENFPRLLRLSSLSLSGNVIETIDANNLSKNLPNLHHLDLSWNHISTLLEVSNLGQACRAKQDGSDKNKNSESHSNNGKLECLNLHGNPVQRRQHYRLYTIHSIPSLKVLDHQRITQTERDRARRLSDSAAGAALESDVQDEAGRQKTFTPGEGESAEESFVVNFTAEEKEQICQIVANAESPAEIEEIERSVQRGVFPEKFLKKTAGGETNDTDDNENNNRKRPLPPPDAEEVQNESEKKIKS